MIERVWLMGGMVSFAFAVALEMILLAAGLKLLAPSPVWSSDPVLPGSKVTQRSQGSTAR